MNATATLTPPQLLPGLTIVLPCLDEEDNLVSVLHEARAAGRRVAAECEIIVVDDGSQDATAVIATAESGVRCIRHQSNRGRGAAVRSGLAAARMPYVLVADGDGQCELDRLPCMVAALANADIVVGRRSRQRGRLGRRLAGHLRTRALRRVASFPVHDPECSLKLLRRSALDGIELRSDGRALDAELLIKCVRAGATVTEVHVGQRPRRAGGRPHDLLSEASDRPGELEHLRPSASPRAGAP